MVKLADLEDIKKKTYDLNVSKAKHFVDIPTKFSKQSDKVFSKLDCKNTKFNTGNSFFLYQLRYANVKLCFKESSQNKEES